MKMIIRRYILPLAIFSFPIWQGAKLIAKNWIDPRDSGRVEKIILERESNAFKDDLQGQSFRRFFFPGLKAAQLSYIWLETLQGVHYPSSYERDYSWLFSKLHTFAVYSDPSEYRRLLAISPLLFVLGKDPIGATILMNELIHRAGGIFTPWYWGGYHALENLKDRNLAAEMFYQCSKREGSPSFVASLAERLGHRELASLNQNEKESFKDQLHPSLRDSVQK